MTKKINGKINKKSCCGGGKHLPSHTSLGALLFVLLVAFIAMV